MNIVVHRIWKSAFAPVLLWGVAGSVWWWIAAGWYENLLGEIAFDLFPKDHVFLYLKDHVFSIGLNVSNGDASPELTFTSHNFGFGLVVTGAVIMGMRGRAWILRLIGLACVWTLLMVMHTGLLVAASRVYPSAASQQEVPLGFSIFLKTVHPVVAVLPIVIIMLWMLIPLEMFIKKDGRDIGVRRIPRRKRKKRSR